MTRAAAPLRVAPAPLHIPAPPRPLTPPKPPGTMPFLPPHELSWLAGHLGPPERKALRAIVEAADLIDVDGQSFLVAPVDADTIEALAAFEAEGEDRECDGGVL